MTPFLFDQKKLKAAEKELLKKLITAQKAQKDMKELKARPNNVAGQEEEKKGEVEVDKPLDDAQE